jgi:hypothetical protein
MRRLWAFLEELDELGARDITAMPNISTVRGTGPLAPFSGINMRVPSERPTRPAGTPVKPPSVFRRRPD